MSRVAICLFGKIGGTKGKNGEGQLIDYTLCYKHYAKHVLGVNDCDVFIHCWNPEVEEEITTLYQPTKAVFEPPRADFEKRARKRKLVATGGRGYSRWFSTKRVVELKSEYEKEQDFTYDWVMLTRFDTMFFVDLDFSKLKKGRFYAPIWNLSRYERPSGKLIGPDRINRSLTKESMADLWFIGTSNQMDRFATLYDHYDEYSVSPHKAVWQHVEKVIGNPRRKTVKYILYRGDDYELYRWKVCGLFK